MAPIAPLSADSLASLMAASLPKDTSPQIKGAYDAIALVVHAGMIAVGFKLKGLGEDHTIEAHSDSSSPQPLPSEWNSSNTYSFRYTHNQSSLEYILKVNRLGNKAVIDGIALGDDKRTSFDVTIKDYISEGNLPSSPFPTSSSSTSTNTTSNSTSEERDDEAKLTIQHIFISPGRLADVGAELKVKIIQKLAPSLTKDGYEESSTNTTTQETDPTSGRRDPYADYPRREPQQPEYDPLRHEPPPARPHPLADPYAGPDRNRPYPPGLEPPGFEDEHEILRGPRGNFGGGGRQPFGIGGDDLYPPGMGPNDGIRPHLGPGGLPRPGGGGGGMHPTFDDPLFGGRGGRGRGGDMQNPEGARYDQVYPGDPRGGPGGFPGAGHRGPGGAPPNPFGGFGGGDFI
ncbi:hypothetical protein EJ08DRAFT_651114 [Tothia fuscella]|uniref:Proteasome inhibitor PI31 subunit n=1 Tax=Tothia fuscella TaxID=1048955 RepID=A0A9P4TWV4_9PEZI|nr:hypothetical protein EJ08DRAFT_651114 [Tothia fuscella]